MYLMQAVPAAVFLIALFFIPESPRYLVSKGRIDEAGHVLTRLFGRDAAATKVAEIKASFSADHRPRLSDLFDPVKGGVRPIVWAGLLLAVFQQLVGINVIFYYGATLWQLAGFTEDQSLQINIVSGIVSIAACLGTILLVDRIGRKPLLLIAEHEISLGDVGFALRMSRDGDLRGAGEGWLAAEPRRPAGVAAEDSVKALVALGYNASIAKAAVPKAMEQNEGAKGVDLIKAALALAASGK